MKGVGFSTNDRSEPPNTACR